MGPPEASSKKRESLKDFSWIFNKEMEPNLWPEDLRVLINNMEKPEKKENGRQIEKKEAEKEEGKKRKEIEVSMTIQAIAAISTTDPKSINQENLQPELESEILSSDLPLSSGKNQDTVDQLQKEMDKIELNKL